MPEILSTGLEIGSFYLVESKCSSYAKVNNSWSVVGSFLALGVTSGKDILKMKSGFSLCGSWYLEKRMFCECPNQGKICLGENALSDTFCIKEFTSYFNLYLLVIVMTTAPVSPTLSALSLPPVLIQVGVLS